MKYLISFFVLFALSSAEGMDLSKPLFEINVAISTCQGARAYMEDYYKIIPQEPKAFFAVYDGHCGSATAHFVSENLHRILKKNLTHGAAESVENVLVNSFQEIDKQLEQEKIPAGSTALVAVVDKNRLYLAWVGDSRALLIRDNKLVLETFDHKPHAPQEKERIISGGFFWVKETNAIIGNRVSRLMPDSFALSRALGNHSYKCKQKGAMIAIPEVISTEIKAGDLLLLASDGLYDDLSNDTIVNLIATYKSEPDIALQKDCIYSSASRLALITSFLCDNAVRAAPKNNADNITVMLVDFKAQ